MDFSLVLLDFRTPLACFLIDFSLLFALQMVLKYDFMFIKLLYICTF